MALSRIISVRNVGRLRNSAASGDVTFRRYNFMFAENGRGKTTLCAILRSLQTGDGAPVAGRQTLGSQDRPEIRILLNGGVTALFANGAWDRTVPELAVFDGTYITENVHAGEAVSTDHRRNLYRVIIGEQGVQLAGRLDELDAQIRDKNGDIRNAKTAVDAHIPQGMTTEAFLNLPDDPDIDAKIAAKETELKAAREVDQIRAHPALDRIGLPALPEAFASTLANTIDGVSADAEALVRAHIAAHGLAERGEPWLSEGLSHIRDDACPFCAQSVAGLPLIDAYKAYFSEAYDRHRSEIESLANDIRERFGDRELAGIERTLDLNAGHITFWTAYCALAAPVLADREAFSQSLRGLRAAALALLDRKLARPLDAIAQDQAFAEAFAGVGSRAGVTGAYNAAVDQANILIATRKVQAGAADVTAINVAIVRLKAQKVRQSPVVSASCDQLQARQGEKTALESAKTAVRTQLDTHTAQVITRYGDAINRFLDAFNAGFRITTPTHSYRGGTASTSYQIVINGTPVDIGDATTPADRPSFRNTLSAGDRSTLALALFFAQLEQHPNRANVVAVFDDPFTSQDNFRRSHTAYQIRKCGEACAQVIVLSHDQTFLKLVWDKIGAPDRKTLQLARVGEDNTTIVEWDIEKACQARYKADVETLQRYHGLNEGTPRDVIQKIRPVIEGYCRNLYPAQFSDADMMGAIVGKIRAAGVAHTLFPLADSLEELNEYCRRYHHAENPNAATEAIDDNELKGYVRRTLTLTGCF